MKRWNAFIGIILVICMIFISACSTSTPATTAKLDKIRLVGTIGPMSIPLAYMKEHNSLSAVAKETTLDIWANPMQLQAIISGGQGDFVSLPTNSAATFYNKGLSLKLLDCSIWNILYLVTTDTNTRSLKDLKGKKVVIPYQGAVPDAIFQVAAKGQGLNLESDIDVFYAADPVQGSQLLLSGQEKYALLSEPSATSVILKGQGSGTTFIRALNMQAEWQKATGGSKTGIAGTIVLGAMKDRTDVISVFTAEYKKAVQWMLDNPEEAGKLGAKTLSTQGFTAEALTQSAKNIDWNYVSAANARPDLENFFEALMQVSPNFIGGKLPDDGFYGKQ